MIKPPVSKIKETIEKAVLDYFKKNGTPYSQANLGQGYEMTVDGKAYRIMPNGNGYKYYRAENVGTSKVILKSTARELQTTISNWYTIL